MAKKFTKVLWVFLIIFLIGCAEKSPKILIKTNDKNVPIDLEIADEEMERREGLMFRERLAERSGMLFIFENEKVHSFWMKNTLIPLDMIFIGSNLKIVDILHAEPCRQDPCEIYTPSSNAMYVLEVQKGTTEREKIEIGDEIELQNIVN